MAIATVETRVAVRTLATLGEAVRLRALQVLVEAGAGGARPSDIAVALGVTQAKLSRQLRILEREGLAKRGQRGEVVVYRARAAGLRAAHTVLAEVTRSLTPERPRET